MKKENRRLYGLLISVDGSIKYAEIPIESAEKWSAIKQILKTTTTKQLPAGGFNGVNRILVYNYYGSHTSGENVLAMKLTGNKKQIYGDALLFKESSLGYPSLMTEAGAQKMKTEVQRGW